MELRRRGDEFAVMASGRLLMSSRQHGSEESLAQVGCGWQRRPESPAVLVGGLGLGYTLRAALELLPPDAEVTVAELVPALVAWNRTHLSALAGAPLDDPRVQVHEGDVGKLLGRSPQAFDAVLLDVDNGPSAITTARNDGLYGRRGLARAAQALRRGGRVVVWSAGEDAGFLKRLAEAGLRASVVRVPVRGKARAQHVLFVGERS